MAKEDVMYIPHQFLIAIENERLQTAARRQSRIAARRDHLARLARAADGAGRRPRRLGRRVTGVFGHRAPAKAAA